jgi:hypothetical protein
VTLKNSEITVARTFTANALGSSFEDDHDPSITASNAQLAAQWLQYACCCSRDNRRW